MRMSPIIMCLNTWSPVDGAVWVGSGGVDLWEEVCHGGELRLQSYISLTVYPLWFLLRARDV